MSDKQKDMDQWRYKISRSVRITAGVLAALSFISLFFLVAVGTSLSELWYAPASCLIAGAVFLYAAVKGKSPAFLEDPLWFAKLLAKRREQQQVVSGVKRVLFVCVENSCRSQIAEAFA